MPIFPRIGIKRLSELEIDADKDWNTKNIDNPGNVDGIDISAHAANPSAHHVKTSDASEITSGRFGVSRLNWTANKLLKGAGAGADPTEIDVPPAPLDALAGDILVAYADTERSHVGTTATKKKEIKIKRPGTYRINFDGKESASYAGNWGQIYRNGVAVGTQRQTGTTYVTYSEDIAGWNAGDLCQIYLRSDGTRAVYVKNFRIYILSFYEEVTLD